MRQNLLKCTLLLCALIVGGVTCWGDNVTYDFTAIEGFSSWGSSYTDHNVEYNAATVIFASANKSTQTITNQPVTKGQPVSLVMKGGNTLNTVSFVCTQWASKAQTITLKYSTDGGSNYSTLNPSVTSTNFTISCNSLPEGTNAVQITFSSSSNQVGIASASFTYTPGSNPSISADNVDLAYDATAGSISPTINNAVNGGVLSAAITAGNDGSWLSLGAVSTTVPLTCSENTTTLARSATVTLTYTYDTNKSVKKDVTVTQAANPNVFDNISSITAVGTTYAVKGTVVAINSKGLVIGDGTGYVYYYKNGAVTQTVGNKITISGTTGTYGHIIQFTSKATVAEAATSNYNYTPAVTVVDATAIAAYNTDYQLSDYVQFEGALVKDNNSNYNITIGTASARISYPTTGQVNTLNNLLNKTVRVKGYFTGFSSNYFTVMLESVEEVVAPTITATPTTCSGFTYMPDKGPSASRTITVAGSNLSADITLTASAYYEICLSENGDYTNVLTLTQSAGSVASTKVYVRLKAGLTSKDYDGTVTLTSTGANDVTINLSGNVKALATLPFSWTGTGSAGKAELDAVTGVELNLGSDFAASNAPYRLKFDDAGKYVTIYTNEKPEAVAFSAKIFNAASTGSKIKVQGSADGITFDDIEEFTIKGANDATFGFTTRNEFTANHRVVRITMSSKDQNVGVGSILISTAPVAISTTLYTTYCNANKNIDFEGTGVKAYTVSNVAANSVTLTEVTKAPAGTPLLLKADAAGTYALNVTNAADAVGTNYLLVSDGTVTGGAGIYALANKAEGVGFYLVKNTVTIPVGKCYLNTGATTTKEFYPFDFDDATAIAEVNGEGVKVNGAVYDLSGRQVQKPSKGIYLINGKKVAIK